MKTVTGLEWHEEVRTVEDGIVYSVFRKLELVPSKMVMNTKTEMSNDMTLLLQDNKEFGVFYIAIPKIIEITIPKCITFDYFDCIIGSLSITICIFTFKRIKDIFRPVSQHS